MTFEEALIEHCSPTLAGVKPASPVPLLPQGQRPFRAPVPCAPAAVRRPGTAAGHPQGLPPHGLLPALPVPGAGSGGGAGPQRAPGFSARYGLHPVGGARATACGSWPPASVWRRNFPTRLASFWAILWMT